MAILSKFILYSSKTSYNYKTMFNFKALSY